MLTDKTIKLVVNYENYNYPKAHVHKFTDKLGNEYTSLDLWHEQGLAQKSEWYFLEEKLHFSKDESYSLEEKLLKNSSSEPYEITSQFIKFVIDKPFYCERSDSLIHNIGHQYLIEKKNIAEFSPEFQSVITDWFESEEGKIAFYEQYFNEQKFSTILPIYVQRLRNIL